MYRDWLGDNKNPAHLCGLVPVDRDTDLVLVATWREGKPVLLGYCMPRGSLQRHNAVPHELCGPLHWWALGTATAAVGTYT